MKGQYNDSNKLIKIEYYAISSSNYTRSFKDFELIKHVKFDTTKESYLLINSKELINQIDSFYNKNEIPFLINKTVKKKDEINNYINRVLVLYCCEDTINISYFSPIQWKYALLSKNKIKIRKKRIKKIYINNKLIDKKNEIELILKLFSFVGYLSD